MGPRHEGGVRPAGAGRARQVARTPSADRAPLVGNHYDKYGTRNPVARWLMQRFLRSVGEHYLALAPSSVLEVGCGEGRLANHLRALGPAPDRFEACDLSLACLAPEVDPSIQFSEASIYDLPWPTRSFELVVACEVLEHLEEPRRALSELRRVARSWLLLSAPREPLWRVLNLLRGSYWSDWGNTPGHVQHFGRASLVRLVSEQSTVVKSTGPLPWTIVTARR